MLPTAKQLGISQLHFARYRENGGWREVKFWGDKHGIHVEPYKAGYLVTETNRQGLSPGTLGLILEIVAKAQGLGFDAWTCDNNPRNGGYIKAK